MAVNPIEAEQICRSAESALRRGNLNLHQFPGLLKRVIDEQMWLKREVPGLGLVELPSLRELITEKPLRGWGELPEQIEAVIREDAEVLRLFRQAMTPKKGKRKKDNSYNVTIINRGNRRGYTLDRLAREAPTLYRDVVDGHLSAHAAAVKAGFRKVKTPLEQVTRIWQKLSADDQQAFLDWAMMQKRMRKSS